MSIFVGQLIQGQAMTLALTTSVGAFQGNEVLTGTVSTGGTDAAILTLAPTWLAGQVAGSYKLVNVPFTAVNTAVLAPGYYVLQVSLADSTAALAWGLLEVVAAAGQSPLYDWLIQPAEVLGQVPDIVTVDNLADLPRVLTATTQAIRRYCNRNFTRVVRTKEFRPSQSGQIRLDEIPVNQVQRVAVGRTNALRVSGPSTAQLARVAFASTGDYDTGLVTTGLTLTSTTSGVTTTTTLLFATYTTIGALAAAITTAGWSASVTTGYSAWPSTELVGGEAGQGALNSDGAWLDVYGEDASLERLDAETGMIWLRSRVGSASWNHPAWGFDQFAVSDTGRFPTLAKVTYDAGFSTIPSPVVMATIETIQAVFSRLATDQVIQSERAADYSYTLRDQLDAIPDSAKHTLSPYRIFNA